MIIAVCSPYLYFKLIVKIPGIIKLGEIVDYAQFLVFLFAFPQPILGFLAIGDIANITLNHFMMIDKLDITNKFYGHWLSFFCLQRQIFVADISFFLQFQKNGL